ncbi:histone-lysine N-methyltransferase SETMAR-like [Cydia fagiglandana]|uniref:histone-lysine N-methyltransferase SETMAR-like n=1 Tax=Cydia fagiglandana TaxID=1458189 RepID=UPI002FEDE60D
MSKIEYRSVIKFLFKEGLSPTQIKDRLDGVYGESSPSYSTVKNWVNEFRFGRETVEDLGHDGRPVEVLTPENINSVQEEVLSDRRLKIREIAARLGLSKSTVHCIIHDHLHMSKVCARWVPKLLSAVQKEERVKCASKFLELCDENPTNIIERLVTGDETMVLYYDPESKRESMEWRFKNEKPPIKAKVHQSSKKLMCTIFWDCHGILMVDFKEIINSEYYASLIHKLRASIKEKRRGKLAKGVLLLHDNAPVHTAFVAKAAVRECGFTEVDHPPYSPDMAPSDYFLLPNLKRDLRGKKFFNDEDLEAAVLGHFEDKISRYFYKGIEMLIQRCQKCVDIKGDYIEK